MNTKACRSKPIFAKPFLKWAGGKRQLLPLLLDNIPANFNNYHEPMVGGGALFFALRPQSAYLSDINPELINVYKVLRDDVDELLESLKSHIYEKDYYYDVRKADRLPDYKERSKVEKASRFLYLNKTCFNGLYRVNSNGQFNVPFGKYSNPRIVDEENLRAVSNVLKDCIIETSRFERIAEIAVPNDFVYFDPPYIPLSSSSSFTSYTKEDFDMETQAKLRDTCVSLDERGVQFLLSNSSAEGVYSLYKQFNIQEVEATRAINSKADKRGKIKELLIKNY